MTRPLNVQQVGEELGISRQTVKRIPPAEMPYFTVGNRRDRRYKPEDVAGYIERRKVTT